MSAYLLDTDVISMLAPARATVSAKVLDWLERMDAESRLFLAAVTIHEIEKGIALLEYKRAKEKAARLQVWLTDLIATYGDKIIAFDAAAATFAGRLEAKAIAAGHNPGMADAAIAGIAQAHDLIVLTGNTRHFLPFGIPAWSPDAAVAAAMPAI
ncbi:MAG: PIN domain-containing protein [Pseudomonadales bacterium]|nr:PIN domain-containing protein [Pseudomonadales bacterium]